MKDLELFYNMFSDPEELLEFLVGMKKEKENFSDKETIQEMIDVVRYNQLSSEKQ
tara:strand:+ start:592 stop:756 length:165 start_codon:yes stop_codon:yes gene_type:complete